MRFEEKLRRAEEDRIIANAAAKANRPLPKDNKPSSLSLIDGRTRTETWQLVTKVKGLLDDKKVETDSQVLSHEHVDRYKRWMLLGHIGLFGKVRREIGHRIAINNVVKSWDTCPNFKYEPNLPNQPKANVKHFYLGEDGGIYQVRGMGQAERERTVDEKAILISEAAFAPNQSLNSLDDYFAVENAMASLLDSKGLVEDFRNL